MPSEYYQNDSEKPSKLKEKPSQPAVRPPQQIKFPNRPPFFQLIFIWFWKIVNLFVPWHKLPAPLGAFNLLAFRYEGRAENLYDVYPTALSQGRVGDPPMDDPRFLVARNSDGHFNSLEQPKMGCTGMRFGRNVPRSFTKPPNHIDLMRPNPRIISEKLLQRDKFKPATIVNLLAAAWIQFQVHDWFMHKNDEMEKIEVPLPKGDKWSDKKMRIERTLVDKPLDDMDQEYPTYRNINTHWWDLSQIYGSTELLTKQLRAQQPDGKLLIDLADGQSFIPHDKIGVPKTGFNSNWWIGLEMLHTLFILEHNVICDELHQKYPDWSGDKIFDTARLVNCALSAKIHTVEWTPAILNHPTLDLVMHTNWWGFIGEKLHKLIGRVDNGEVLSGIPGSGADQDGVPFSLTEEFASVYRLHPLIPDNIAFFDVKSGEHRSTTPMADVAFTNARNPLLGSEEKRLKWRDVFYSFGVNYPGAITVNNMPNFLRDLHTPDNRHLDMGTVDIVRDRERGVPRYNQFRRLFHMKPVADFVSLTGGNKELASRLEDIYEGDIESVDLLVGCLSEPLPEGFGFSDTAFRVFILMASRRLKSDRFIATAWNTKVYSQVGMDWVQNNTMVDVLCRHFPELREPLKGKDNAFRPWNKVGKTAEYKGEETNA